MRRTEHSLVTRLSPLSLSRKARSDYGTQIGPVFGARMARAVFLIFVGFWVMPVAAGVMVIAGVVTLIATRSLRLTLLAVLLALIPAALGYCVKYLGSLYREHLIRSAVRQMLAQDPGLTPYIARELVIAPAKLTPWLARNPDFAKL
jgi:hypothetical protein